MLRRIPASAYRRMPWKNGGGATTEIALEPEGATLDAFTWRVSIAELQASGPFSRFPGYDRILVQIEGPPMTLRHAGVAVATSETHALVALEPYAFAGELETSAVVPAPSRDFNVMVRRGAASAHVVCHRLARHAELIDHANAEGVAERLAYVLEGEATASLGDTSCHLATSETAIASGPGSLVLEAGTETALVLLVAIQRYEGDGD